MINKTHLNGIVLSLIIGISAFVIAHFITFFNAILLGLLLGIIIGNTVNISQKFTLGITFTSSKLLELSIVFLAFGINYADINTIGWENLLIIILMIVFALASTLFLSKKLNCPSNVGYLVGFGTSICGSSAIAALAPNFKDNKEDIGVSLAVVNLFGVIGMIVLPTVLPYMGLTNLEMGVIIGGSLHAVGNVVGAGYAMSQTVGDFSLMIKMARVALLSPALILFSLFINKNKETNWKKHLNLPWYLWAFIVISIIVSTVSMPDIVLKNMDFLGKISLTIAMSAIGLKVGFKSLLTSARKGLLFGAIIFIMQLLFLIALLFLFR
jgi:uncharacterized integral membrane protein (TIGR00698 family)